MTTHVNYVCSDYYTMKSTLNVRNPHAVFDMYIGIYTCKHLHVQVGYSAFHMVKHKAIITMPITAVG